jgi:hypothetical protein
MRTNEVVREEASRWSGSAGLSRRQPERGSKGCWDAEELDRDVTSCWRTCIANQPLFPRETRVRSLRTGQDHVRGAWRSGGRRQTHLDALVSHKLHTSAPVLSAAPIPRSRSGAGSTRSACEPHTHLTRLSCWTAERPIRLERKVGSCEAPRFPRRVALMGGP